MVLPAVEEIILEMVPDDQQTLVQIAKFERFITGREIQVGEEKRVVGNPAEGTLGDFVFPVIRRAGLDALAKHREGAFVLRGEDLLEVGEHGWVGRALPTILFASVRNC